MESLAARLIERVVALVVAASVALAAPGTSWATPSLPPELLSPSAGEVVDVPRLAWQSVRGASLYRVEVASDPSFTNVVHTAVTPANRYEDTMTWQQGDYWWRVKVIAPFNSRYSPARSVKRQWLTSNRGRVARPDDVTVADFSSESGTQAPANALEISWSPVPNAAYYEVQFDGRPETTCATWHTTFTPYLSGFSSGGTQPCYPAMALGTHTVQVRAVDQIPERDSVFSLWSSQARGPSELAPGPLVFTVGPPRSGTVASGPANLTGPGNATVFEDAPVLKWDPVIGATEYRVLIARDRGFGKVVTDLRTPNTRLIASLEPSKRPIQTYYWTVLPCSASGGGAEQCLDPGSIPSGSARWFRKQTVKVDTESTHRTAGPWSRFAWQPTTTTASRFAHRTGIPHASTAGVLWYEIGLRAQGQPWRDGRVVVVDRTQYLPSNLAFGTRFEWRVRQVAATGAGAWSPTRRTRTPRAVASRPIDLRATRIGARVVINWDRPPSAFFPVVDYTVYISRAGVRWRPLVQVSEPHAVMRLRKNQRYWFMITANNTAGESRPTKIFVPG